MKTILVTLAAALVCAPMADAQTQSQMIVGKWTCGSITPDGYTSMQVEYGADGVSHAIMIVGLSSGDATGHAILDVKSKWSTPGDGTLRDQVTDFRVVEFVFDGKPANSAGLAAEGEKMKSQEIKSGSLQITATTMTMLDETNVTTNCVR